MKNLMSKRAPIRWTFAGLFCLFIIGCTSIRDVSQDKGYLGSSEIGAIYRLRLPVYNYDTNTGRIFFNHNPVAPGFWLLPEKSEAWVNMPSFSDYKKSSGPAGITGIVQAGSSIQLTKIIYYNYFEGSTSFYEYVFCEGAFKGRRVCGNELMEAVAGNRLHRLPNRVFLERIK